MSTKFDVIIIGAGPAGATCAFELAKKGVEVLLLDKKKFPREKFCGGGIPGSIINRFSIEPKKISALPILKYILTFQGKNKNEGEIEEGLLYSIKRSKFDYELVKKAQEKGATFYDNSHVINLRLEGSKAFITLQNHKIFSSRFLVAADGGHSFIVNKFPFLKKQLYKNVGTCGYYEVRVDQNIWKDCFNTVHLDFNFFQGGVIGIIPKEDHFWIGAYTAKKINLNKLKKYTEQFMEHFKIKGKYKTFKGLFLPLYNKNMNLIYKNILLIGEAASFVNPLSGEGIKPAVDSSIIASEEIYKAIKEGGNLSDYSQKSHNKIGKELIIAEKLSNLAYLFPSIAYNGITRTTNDALKILNGNLSYKNFKDRLKTKIIKRLMKYGSRSNT